MALHNSPHRPFGSSDTLGELGAAIAVAECVQVGDPSSRWKRERAQRRGAWGAVQDRNDEILAVLQKK